MGKVLCGIHSLLAGATKIPELELDDNEGAALGEAMKTVAAQYDYIPDEKIVAWVALIGTCASIYGPRLVAYKLRASVEKEQRRREKPAPAMVSEGTPNPATPQNVAESSMVDMLAGMDFSGKGH